MSTDRLSELKSKRAEEGDDPELDGRIGWHENKPPSSRGDYDAGLPLGEQSDNFQSYYAGYEAEARQWRKLKETA